MSSQPTQTHPSGQPPGREADPPDSLWRTLGAREVYRNPWLRVTEYAVTRPDGAPGVYGVVDPGDNATIVALDDDERVWLMEDFLYPLQARGWFLPGGSVDAGEEPLAAAQRELEEEAGLRAARWDALGAFYTTPGIATQRSYLFLARDLTAVAHVREPTEAAMTARLTPLREALAASLRGETPAAIAALGLTLAWNFLHPTP